MKSNRIRKISLGVLCAMAVVSASAKSIYREGWIDRNKNDQMDSYENPALSTDVRVADLLERMTLDEKTCQLATIYGYKRILKNPQPVELWKKRVWKDGVANIDEHCNGVRGEKEFTDHVELLNEAKEWVVGPGKFEVCITNSSAHEGVQQEGAFVIQE